jgi:DNA-directed RNA polymerase specialized sigma24 family protein
VSHLSVGAQPPIEQVYRDERLKLVRLAYLLTGSRDVAEDVVQSAFAAAHSRWSRIEEPVAYLRQAIVNQAKDVHRRRYRRPPPPPPPGPPPPRPVGHCDSNQSWHASPAVPALYFVVEEITVKLGYVPSVLNVSNMSLPPVWALTQNR